MNQFAKVKRITMPTSQGDITFRSTFEYCISCYLDFLIRAGEIDTWRYEKTSFELPVKHRKYLERLDYWPDFQVIEGACGRFQKYFWLEAKGHLSQKDYNKIKTFAQEYPDERIQVWADGLPKGKTPKSRTKLRRWQRLEPWVERILDANPLFAQVGIDRKRIV